MSFDKKKIAGGVAGVVVGAALPIAYLLGANLAGLTLQSVLTLGILLWAIVWWVAAVIPEFATALIMAVLFVVIAGVAPSTVFSTFASSTWWLLVSAFALGLGMKKSGLMNRMAMAIVRIFPSTFASQTLALFAAGTIVGPLIPSGAAKCAMITPLAQSIGSTLGFKPQDKQMSGMFLAAFLGVRNASPLFISASITGYAMLATLPADVQSQFNMVAWALAALPWFIVVSILNYVALFVLFGPKKKGDGTHVAKTGKDGSTMRSEAMSSAERRMCAIIALTLALWVTEPLHGVPAFAVGLLALVSMVAFGVIDKADFKSGIAWDSLVFIGLTLGLAPVFSSVGLNDWIMGLCGPVVSEFGSNPYILVLGTGVLTLVMRFIIVSEIAYINLFMAFAVPVVAALGVNPWVIGFAAYAMVIAWFGKYQSPIYMAAFYSVDGQMAKHGDMVKYCVLYELTCLAGLAVSVPFWQLLGLI